MNKRWFFLFIILKSLVFVSYFVIVLSQKNDSALVDTYDGELWA